MKRLENVMVASLILLTGLNLMPTALAQDHIVSKETMRNSIEELVSKRDGNIRRVEQFLSSARVKSVIERFHPLDLERVEQVIPTLSDRELETLASEVEELDKEIEAGALSNQQLTYIVVALATAVIILIVVQD